jgi:CDP-diacylglycerol--glycerol-3-phosphate 3-phosphatidyltransferase/cardiolipin synthase
MARGVVARIATIPNMVSLSRIPMAAAFAVLHTADERLLLLAAAAATDVLDGFIARRVGAVTRIGALIDPLADRCFVLVAVVCLLAESSITELAALILAVRDIAVVLAFAASRWWTRLRKVRFIARPPGKVVTALQLATVGVAYLAPPWLATFVAVTGVASVVAIVDYARALSRQAANA